MISGILQDSVATKLLPLPMVSSHPASRRLQVPDRRIIENILHSPQYSNKGTVESRVAFTLTSVVVVAKHGEVIQVVDSTDKISAHGFVIDMTHSTTVALLSVAGRIALSCSDESRVGDVVRLLQRILENVISHPTEQKFRRLDHDKVTSISS